MKFLLQQGLELVNKIRQWVPKMVYLQPILKKKKKKKVNASRSIQLVSRIQSWIKTFSQNSENVGYSFIKNYIIYMYLPFSHKTPIILSLSKIVTLSFTKNVLMILTFSLDMI